MKLEDADTKKLVPMLEQLGRAIETLLLTGLTTASESTVQALTVSFQESSRAGLLRLGSNLRVACEELTRYTQDQKNFSAGRFSFFLNRSWLLTRGLLVAMNQNDGAEFDRLTWNPTNTSIDRIEMVTLGVSKKYLPGAFCSFEFRLRNLNSTNELIAPGEKIIWSIVFPAKQKMEIPPEAFLHLPQKQNFVANSLLDGNSVIFTDAFISKDRFGAVRISLGEKSTVMPGEKYLKWDTLTSWSSQAALDRLNAYEPGPLDLEVELQEEVFLEDWKMDAKVFQEQDAQVIYSLQYRGAQFDVVISKGSEGESLRKMLEKAAAARSRPTLFGLLHYEKCRLTLQPLSLIGKNGPEYATLSKEKIDRVALLRTLNLKSK